MEATRCVGVEVNPNSKMVAYSNTRANGGSAIVPVAVVYICGCCTLECLGSLVNQKIIPD